MFTRAMILVSCGGLLAACGAADDGPAETPPPAPAAQETNGGGNAPAAGLTRTPAPADADVYFIEPSDGATVSSPVRVVFGLTGAGVAPAGIEQSGTGHHHLLIDTEPPPSGAPIPADDSHVHFGGGQTETEIELPPGEHSLQLLFADHLHVPHDPPIMSDRITINVQ